MKIMIFKNRLHSLKKLATKEISISMKTIFNVPSKNVSFKEKLSLYTFKKHGLASCSSKEFPSHDKSYNYTFIKITENY